MKPTNRKEIFMEALANGSACPIVPTTREEKYLAAQAEREAAAKPDWNQNDPTAPDYVKNRPFYSESTTEFVRETREFKATSASGGVVEDLEFAKLLWEHRESAEYAEGGNSYAFQFDVEISGNYRQWRVGVAGTDKFKWIVTLHTDDDGNLTGKIVFGDNGTGYFSNGSITVEAEVTRETVRKLDAKYLPDDIGGGGSGGGVETVLLDGLNFIAFKWMDSGVRVTHEESVELFNKWMAGSVRIVVLTGASLGQGGGNAWTEVIAMNQSANDSSGNTWSVYITGVIDGALKSSKLGD